MSIYLGVTRPEITGLLGNPYLDHVGAEQLRARSRLDFAVAAYKNKIYVIGGSPVESRWQYYCGVNEVYDPAIDAWETKTDMPTKRGGLCATVVNNKIYLIAGQEDSVDGNPNISVVNEVYDPEADASRARQNPYP